MSDYLWEMVFKTNPEEIKSIDATYIIHAKTFTDEELLDLCRDQMSNDELVDVIAAMRKVFPVLTKKREINEQAAFRLVKSSGKFFRQYTRNLNDEEVLGLMSCQSDVSEFLSSQLAYSPQLSVNISYDASRQKPRLVSLNNKPMNVLEIETFGRWNPEGADPDMLKKHYSAEIVSNGLWLIKLSDLPPLNVDIEVLIDTEKNFSVLSIIYYLLGEPVRAIRSEGHFKNTAGVWYPRVQEDVYYVPKSRSQQPMSSHRYEVVCDKARINEPISDSVYDFKYDQNIPVMDYRVSPPKHYPRGIPKH